VLSVIVQGSKFKVQELPAEAFFDLNSSCEGGSEGWVQALPAEAFFDLSSSCEGGSEGWVQGKIRQKTKVTRQKLNQDKRQKEKNKWKKTKV
jgi:hypothetical protein